MWIQWNLQDVSIFYIFTLYISDLNRGIEDKSFLPGFVLFASSIKNIIYCIDYVNYRKLHIFNRQQICRIIALFHKYTLDVKVSYLFCGELPNYNLKGGETIKAYMPINVIFQSNFRLWFYREMHNFSAFKMQIQIKLYSNVHFHFHPRQ